MLPLQTTENSRVSPAKTRSLAPVVLLKECRNAGEDAGGGRHVLDVVRNAILRKEDLECVHRATYPPAPAAQSVASTTDPASAAGGTAEPVLATICRQPDTGRGSWPTMDRAVDYLRRAEEDERQAARAPDRKARREFLALAATWRELARQASGTKSP